MKNAVYLPEQRLSIDTSRFEVHTAVTVSEPGPGAEIQDSRCRIVRVSHDLFVEHGYRAVSMQQIADAACIKKPTLYHHFRDKEDLFVTVMDMVFTRSREAIVAALVPGMTLREQLRNVAVHVFASSRSNYGRLIVDLHEQVSEGRRAELLSHCPPPWKLLQPAIAAAVASGEVRPLDEELASRLFFTTIWGHMWLSRDSSYGEPLDDAYAARLVDMLIDGMSACSSKASADGLSSG